MELGYSTDTEPDLATFVARYSSFSSRGNTHAAFEILTDAYVGPGKYQVLYWFPWVGSGWVSFDPTSEGNWGWDCNGDGSSDGGGTVSDFLSICNATAKVAAVALVATSGPSDVDAVELGLDGATTLFDMEPPVIAVKDASNVEGDSGTSPMRFDVTLSGPDDVEIDIPFRTRDGTAIAGKDYVQEDGTMTVPAGSIYPFARVPIIGDTKVENDETFQLRLRAPTNGVYGDSVATGTILNDD